MTTDDGPPTTNHPQLTTNKIDFHSIFRKEAAMAKAIHIYETGRPEKLR
jgi:hypothetical protein